VTIPALYAILDAEVAAARGWTLPDLARACFDGGARLVQVRAKGIGSGWLLEVADAIRAVADPYGARVIVNDRADVAALAGAAGVHVGQDDLPPAAARRVVGGGALVGLSTHSIEQVRQALEEPLDYLAVGPVFGTATKDTGYAPVGLDLVRGAAALAAARALPVVAIGGITLDRAPEVLAAGASSVAVIGDLLATGDPRARARAFVDRLTPGAAERPV
jgi:thiamine-phosphate pyrophosphorylase